MIAEMKIGPSWSKPAMPLAVAGVVLVAAFAVAPEENTFLTNLLAAVTFGLASIPAMLWLKRGGRDVPMFEVLCLYVAVNFGLAAILQPPSLMIQSQIKLFDPSDYQYAQVLALIGLGAMMAGFYCLRRLRPGQSGSGIDMPIQRGQVYLYVVVCLALSYAGRTGLLGGLGAIGKVLGDHTLAAIAVLSLWKYKFGNRSRRENYLLPALVVAASLLGLGGGMMEHALQPVAVYLLIRMAYTRTIPVGLLAVGMVGFVVFNAAKHNYRREVWHGDVEGVVAKTEVWARSIGQLDIEQLFSREDDGPTGAVRNWRDSASRTSLLQRFAWVVSMTPQTVPYFWGETYVYVFYTFIPRVIWRDKPILSAATDKLDFAYGFRDEMALTSHSVGVGQFSEAYANFGPAGLVLVLFLLGVFLGFFNQVFNRPTGFGSVATYVVTSTGFLNAMGTSSVMMIGSVIFGPILCTLVQYPFCRGQLRAPVPPRRAAPPPPHGPAPMGFNRSGPGTRGGPRRPV